MITLGQIIQCQNQGIRQNPYKYKIISILDVFNSRNDDKNVKELRNGEVYLNIEDIPKEYYSHKVYNIEPDINDKTGRLYLKIVLI